MNGPFVVKHLEPCAEAVIKCASCGGEAAWHDEAWVCGACGDEWMPNSMRRVVSVKAFETPARLRRALAGEDYLDLEGLAGMPDTSLADIEAAQDQLEALIRDGKLKLPDGREILVEATTGEALYWATPAATRPIPDDSLAQRLSAIVAAFNEAMAERYTGGLGA